jgi:hypothetical protein
MFGAYGRAISNFDQGIGTPARFLDRERTCRTGRCGVRNLTRAYQLVVLTRAFDRREAEATETTDANQQ